MDLYG
jgi:hypothetical protein